MDARGFVDELAALEGSEAWLAHVEVLEPRDPVYEPFPDIPEVLRRRLKFLGIEALYPHQRAALDLLGGGENVVVATGTASGKTLVYNLAFAGRALGDEGPGPGPAPAGS
jgi:DEAD/DEAH box helicase domain-containing protein